MLLPLDLGVASASTGFPAVEAGGPPSKPAPTRHVTKTRYVPRRSRSCTFRTAGVPRGST
ncbi:hypothetical protein ACFQYP_46235 [Nonomuraea antimicrobica]